MDSKTRLSGRTWFNLVLFGLMGQIAWNVENMYFNTFLYNSVYKGASQAAVNAAPDVMTSISRMVAFSALTAVLTTFLMGNLSDSLNRRKLFISIGYIAWGAVTACFGFITRDNIALLLKLSDEGKILTATVTAVIIADCIMTFVGSTGNDSAFNAWVTDVTDNSNRATVESVLALLPVAAMGVVIALGAVVDSVGYSTFFIVLGCSVVVCGVLGMFSLTETRGGGRSESRQYFKDLLYGFKPSVIKQNSTLYIILSAICIYSVAVQVFFPYLLIYLEHGLGVSIDMLSQLKPVHFAIIGIGLVLAIVGIVGVGRLVDKFGKRIFLIVAGLCFIIGLFAAGRATRLGSFAACAIPLLIGYALLGILLNAAVRDYTPEDKVGLFQGVRMIFFVLIPMYIGPKIGDLACRLSEKQYVNEYGVAQSVPTAEMFTAAAVVSLFIIIPVAALYKRLAKNN